MKELLESIQGAYDELESFLPAMRSLPTSGELAAVTPCAHCCRADDVSIDHSGHGSYSRMISLSWRK